MIGRTKLNRVYLILTIADGLQDAGRNDWKTTIG